MTTDYSNFEELENGTVISSKKYPDSALVVRYIPLASEPARYKLTGIAIAPTKDGSLLYVEYLDANTEIGSNVTTEQRRVLTMLGVQTLEAKIKIAKARETTI